MVILLSSMVIISVSLYVGVSPRLMRLSWRIGIDIRVLHLHITLCLSLVTVMVWVYSIVLVGINADHLGVFH